MYLFQLFKTTNEEEYMAYPSSTKKRIRQAKKRHQHNRQNKLKMKTWMRRVEEAPNKEEARKNLQEAISVIDKTAQKGIIHRNSASNKKSRLARYVNGMS